MPKKPVNQPKSSAKAKSTAKKEQATEKTAPDTPKIIDQSFKNDRSVELRGTVNVTAITAAQVQRALLLQACAKNGDQSSIKFYIGPADSNKFRMQDQSALADTMLLVSRPVDVIIKSGIGPDVLKTFLSATGKRYMLAGAKIHMGVITSNAPYSKNKTSQVRRQLFNDYQSDLQTLVMMKTGEKSRAKVFTDLLSARGYNAIEALYYGERGLIDGVLIGHDQVITREDLEQFYRKKGWKADKIAEFNKHYINVYQLPTRPLKDFAPESVPSGTLSLYKSLKKVKIDEKKKEKEKAETEVKEMMSPDHVIFYIGDKKLDEYPLNVKITKDKSPTRMMVDLPPKSSDSILDDDVIFFNDGFRDETAEQIGEALIALDHKKILNGSKSHIKIIENSPGGSVWSGQELRSLIKTLKTPVDVIVYGMGASCGSWLLCSATGNRLATPNARIMFHEAANELREQTPANHYNEMHDGLDQATLDYIAIVAEATGRPFEEVLTDFDLDVWLNPLECLFYGTKGLLDGILVGHHH